MPSPALAPTQKYPSRFRDPSENKDFFLKLANTLFIRRKLTAEEISRYGDYLWIGDATADKLAVKFHELGMQKAMPMLNAALEGKIAKDAPQELRDLMAEVETEPTWLDKRLLDVGARLSQRSAMLGEYVLSCVSLMGGYRSAAANKPIAFTGQLEYMAPRRLAETAKFGFDVSRTGAMAKGAQGFKSAVKVRMMHAHVRLMLDRSPKWKHDVWGLPINQADLVATNTLFSAVYLSGLRVLGLQISDEESLGVTHLWRYIGYLMGVDEALLPTNEEEGTRMAWLSGVTQPPADEDSRLLGQALMNVPLERAETPVEKIAAHLEMQVRSGLTRIILGDNAGDDLGLPDTPLKYGIAFTTPIIFGMETIRRLVPGLTNIAVLIGDRWQRGMVEKPLAGKPATFVPPESLKREAAYG
jgi:ER-bound oxygenase mpaB/B'/Rubber oxygenase, catalytic domain